MYQMYQTELSENYIEPVLRSMFYILFSINTKNATNKVLALRIIIYSIYSKFLQYYLELTFL